MSPIKESPPPLVKVRSSLDLILPSLSVQSRSGSSPLSLSPLFPFSPVYLITYQVAYHAFGSRGSA